MSEQRRGPRSSEDARASTYTLVAFHAHPDDEALFTGGTLARYSQAGHRVVLVVATAGERGLTGRPDGDLGGTRLAELDRSAAALGVSRVVTLGYEDSGRSLRPPAGSFSVAPLAEAVERLRAVLEEERADVLTVYDEAGGYGHPDHVRVREVGVAAAQAAGTPRVLEATVSREALQRGVRLLNRLGVRPGGMRAADLDGAYRSQTQITHQIDVRRQLRAKRAALAAHASQTTGGADVRTVALLARLPWPLSRAVLGREWFVEVGRDVPDKPLDDLFPDRFTG
jgi:LmbE family N-acetylglucosaminyl deacetylase